MKSLWGRIGFGALAVFLVGMLLVSLVGQAKSAATSALASLEEVRGVGTAPSTVAFGVSVPGRLGICTSARPISCRGTSAGSFGSEQVEAELRDGDPFEATAEMGGDVRVVARGGDGELVRIRADSNGANIRVNDAMGRAILRLLADSSGALLRIRGKDGRDVVRMDAGDGAFSLSIDTSGVQ